MKKLLALITVLALLLSVCSLAFAGAEEDKWAEDNGLNLDESMDELYEKAKAEGKVVIYTISSRTQKVANAFMEAYPGINVEVYDISSGTLKEKFLTEYESGIHTVDILHSKEQVGEYTFERLISTLSGEMTKSEAIKYFNFIDIYCMGPVI